MIKTLVDGLVPMDGVWLVGLAAGQGYLIKDENSFEPTRTCKEFHPSTWFNGPRDP